MMGFSFLAAFSADGLLGRLGGGGLSGTDFVLLVESSVEPGFFTGRRIRRITWFTCSLALFTCSLAWLTCSLTLLVFSGVGVGVDA